MIVAAEGWEMPVYVVEPDDNDVLLVFLSWPKIKFKSLKLIISHQRLKKFRFPGPFEDPKTIGSDHFLRLEDKKDTLYYTKPNLKRLFSII